MPWTRKKSRKLANQTAIALSFVAGISINLLTSWFQQDILSNPLYLICVVVMLAGFGYWVIKTRAPLLIGAFVILVLSVFFNLFSSWFQENILHNEFTTLNVTLILLVTILVLGLSALIGSHPLQKIERKLLRQRRSNIRNRVRLAEEGRISVKRRPQTSKKKRLRTYKR